MKKSNLKYIFYILFLGTIFTLYHWNKKFFESSEYLGQKGGNKSGASSSLNYNSGSSSASGLNFQTGYSNESSGGASESTTSPSYSFSGFSSSGASSSFETKSSSNTNEEEYTTVDNLVAANISNSSGANNSDVGAGGVMSLGIPMIGQIASNDESKEEKTKKQQQAASNSNQTAGKGNFFNGTVETPMAPLPPDQDVPLDGGASILLMLGSMLGVKKLFGKKNIS